MTPRAALVGAGTMGIHHLSALRRAGIEVLGVCASSPSRSAEAARDMNLPIAYGDLEEVLADPSVDVVHLLTPNALHYQGVVAALTAGKHVVCEKPLTTTATEAADLVAREAATTRVTAVGFTKRHHHWIEEVRALLVGESLGKTRAIRCGYLQSGETTTDSRGWRDDPDLAGPGGVVSDLGCHVTDLVSYISGSRFAKLIANTAQAESEPARPSGRVSYAQVLAELDNNAQVDLVFSQRSIGFHDLLWFDVDCVNGALRWNSRNPEELWLSRTRSETELHVAMGRSDPFGGFIESVYSRIASLDSPRDFATFTDGYSAVVVAEAVMASSARMEWINVHESEGIA